MKTLKIGFVPAHREPFDEKWAAQMRQRCLDAFPAAPLVEIIAPDNKLTKNGCVRDDAEAEKVIDLFKKKGVDGLIIGAVTFGDEVSALAVASAFRDKPVLLFGTKEGPFWCTSAKWRRKSSPTMSRHGTISARCCAAEERLTKRSCISIFS